MIYNAVKIKLIKLKHYSRVWIHDLFTPFDTILATVLFVIILSVSSYISGDYSTTKEFDDNIRIGVISSTLVAIIIETQNNLKSNIRRHSELTEYFLELTLLESALDKTKKKEYDTDPLEVLWKRLPRLIRVLKSVNESKLEWLTSTEASAIQTILVIYREVCFELGRYIENEVDFCETDSLLNKKNFGKTINYMPPKMVKELIRIKKREDIDRLVQVLFFEDISRNYDLNKKVCLISDYYIGKPSIDSVEKNVLSECCFAILGELKTLFPYLKYEKIHLTMEILKEKEKLKV